MSNAFNDAGYREDSPRDRAQLRSTFIGGLKKEYKEALLTARPEAKYMPETEIVPVCTGIDDKLRKEKEKERERR